MAANTAVNLTLGARDWEVITSLTDRTSENDLRAIFITLVNYYVANSNPSGATSITIATKEKTLIKIFKVLYNQIAEGVINDVGSSTFKRITDAIRAANNVADNYISTQLSQEDTLRDDIQKGIRKRGREIIMMENFDNN